MALTTGTPLADTDLPAATADISQADNKAQIRNAIGAGTPETTATILDKLKGAALDADRIGGEYMPDVIPTVLVELDTVPTDTILPANTLGVDPYGNPVIGDGLTEGGLQISTPYRKRFVGNREILEATHDAIVALNLGTFAIPSAKAVAGTVIRFRGHYWVVMDNQVYGSKGIGLAGNGVTPISINQCIGTTIATGTAGKRSQIDFDFAVTLYDNTSNLGATIVSSVYNAAVAFPVTSNDANVGFTPTGTPTYPELLVQVEVAPTVPVVAGWNVAKNIDQALGVFLCFPTAVNCTGSKTSYDFEISFE